MEVHDQAVIHSSEDPNWRTPDAAFRLLDKEFDLLIDAAATLVDRKAHHYFGPDHHNEALRDGLTVDWKAWADKTGTPPNIFINPPFSRKQYRLTKNPAMLIENWARKCWSQAQAGCTVVGVFPFAPQTDWYRTFVMGQEQGGGFAAFEERRLTHRISFMRSDGTKSANAGVNSVVIVWKPQLGRVWPWQPAVSYWTYREALSREQQEDAADLRQEEVEQEIRQLLREG